MGVKLITLFAAEPAAVVPSRFMMRGESAAASWFRTSARHMGV
jgi:hypothetical protein